MNGCSEQIIEAGYYCIVNVYSNYGNFKMLVELVLRGPDDDDGDFEVCSRPQSTFLFWDLMPIFLSIEFEGA